MSKPTFDTNTITIRSPTPDDIPSLRALIADTFVRKEPISSWLNISVDEFLPVFECLAGTTIDMYTSTIATLPTGEIISTSLTRPLQTPFDSSNLSRNCMDLCQIFVDHERFFEDILDLKGSNRGKRVLHPVFGATLDGYEGTGISKLLRKETIRKARKEGWDYIVAECSNVKTQHLMRDVFGFEVAAESMFSAYVVNGRKLLEGMEGTFILLYSELQKYSDRY